MCTCSCCPTESTRIRADSAGLFVYHKRQPHRSIGKQSWFSPRRQAPCLAQGPTAEAAYLRGRGCSGALQRPRRSELFCFRWSAYSQLMVAE
jgi:hypothetical protein